MVVLQFIEHEYAINYSNKSAIAFIPVDLNVINVSSPLETRIPLDIRLSSTQKLDPSKLQQKAIKCRYYSQCTSPNTNLSQCVSVVPRDGCPYGPEVHKWWVV